MWRRFLTAGDDLLPHLARTLTFPFEMATGLNGRVWIKASTTEQTVTAVRAIHALDQPDGVMALRRLMQSIHAEGQVQS